MKDTVFGPGLEQADALAKIERWLTAEISGKQIFTLSGYAATGKTTLVAKAAKRARGNVVFAAFTGKASLLRAAVSVWGPWEKHRSWRTTANALEHTAAMHNDMLLPLDELGEISGAQLGEALYLLGNGQGKKRLSQPANPQDSWTWRVLVLSSGEISAQEHMAGAGQRHFAGQEARMLDIAADERCYRAFDQLHGFGDGAAFWDALEERTLGSYGAPGGQLIDCLVKRYAALIAGDCRGDREARCASGANRHGAQWL